MKLLRSLEELTPELHGGAVTIGNFDGVHRGHARIIERLVANARKLAGPAVVFTFDPHPVRLLRPAAAPPPLTWTDRKAELLVELGVDAILAYPTDTALLALPPRAFFERIVLEQLGAGAIVEGPNFYFGHDRAGDVDTLRAYCAEAGIVMEVVPPLVVGDGFVSSSRIRGLIQSGSVGDARALLTHPYRIRGMVTHGAARGASIGFPTANIEAIDTLLPAHAVYAGRAWIDEHSWPAAVNIGPNPTFSEHATKVEAHLIGFHGNLYGQPLELDFLERLRNIQPFPSVDALVAQLRKDVRTAQEIVAGLAPPSGPR